VRCPPTSPLPGERGSEVSAPLLLFGRITGEADGKPFAIVGFLGYRPPPAVSRDARLPAWMIVLAGAGGALILAAALALPLRRREGEDERGEAATGP
jgi:hypothetical protein